MLRLIPLFCLTFLTSNLSFQDQVDNLLLNDLAYLENFYKELHQKPELSLYEKETSAKLAKEMKELGFEVTEQFGGYGIVCVMTNGKGPTVLYRTDMDGLPVIEKTELSYASSHSMSDMNGMENKTMHACGHDMHMTVWLGTARVMAATKDEWKGTLIFIGQPAEEIGAGAELMLDAGLYTKYPVPDYGVGLHASPDLPAGQVGFGKGYTMATAESVDIKIFGYGAHGASPHKSVDPVVLASLMVMELQTIVSRNVDPIESAVVTVGAIHGGTKHNIIPDEVTLQLTLRTFKEEVRTQLHKRIRQIANGIAISAGLPEDKFPEILIPNTATPPNYNNPDLVDRMVKSASKAISGSEVVHAAPQMVAEDFSRYGHTEDQVPTVLFWLGTVPDHRVVAAKNGESIPALHSPFYYPDPQPSIETGVKVVSQILVDLLSEQKG
ncbi:MAG: amidohydrolase [Saprospiraceae bacterium]|nr:amidohydrolase [Saprospiraceae bacterium]